MNGGSHAMILHLCVQISRSQHICIYMEPICDTVKHMQYDNTDEVFVLRVISIAWAIIKVLGHQHQWLADG